MCVTTPQPMPVLTAGVVELAAGDEHACARREDGTVWCWGSNASGQVGDAAPGDHPTPRQVPGLAGAAQLCAGAGHSCALLGAPGQVTCWGDNAHGQLGDGSTASSPAPVAVAGLGDAVEVACGALHTCARHAGGAALRLPNTLNVGFPGVTGSEVLARAPEVAASTGAACHDGRESASAVILAMGVAPRDALGAVRLTLGRGTDAPAVERAAAALIRAWTQARDPSRSQAHDPSSGGPSGADPPA